MTEKESPLGGSVARQPAEREPTDDERAAFKASEHEAMRRIVAGDLICPDPSAHEAAGAPLREALEWALDTLDASDEVLGHVNVYSIKVGDKTTAMARSTQYTENKVKARAALAPTPAPAPLDAGDCAGTHHYGLCTSCGAYITARRHDPSDHDCKGGVKGDKYPL